jgi:hypothetical protein
MEPIEKIKSVKARRYFMQQKIGDNSGPEITVSNIINTQKR